MPPERRRSLPSSPSPARTALEPSDARPAPSLAPFAAVLAGGESRRFGAPKTLARVGGTRIVDRVVRAARGAGLEVVLVANRPEPFADLGLPVRPDTVAGAGALGGIHAALRWASDEGRTGALCLACDMPFLRPGLLRALADRAGAGEAGVVVPESPGRRGLEPLCALYPVDCLPVVERMLAAGERRIVELLERVGTRPLPLEEVRRWGPPEVLFLNVNTPGDHARAVDAAREEEGWTMEDTARGRMR